MSAPPNVLPDSFEFHLGALDDGEWFHFEHRDGVFYYSAGWTFREKPAQEIRCAPNVEHWLEFWHEVEAIGVWDWKPNYTDPCVLDGSGWELKMIWNQRSLAARGDNGYPGGDGPEYSEASSFARFLAALKRLSGVKDAFENLYWK
jgi:hypothetical protein